MIEGDHRSQGAGPSFAIETVRRPGWKARLEDDLTAEGWRGVRLRP